MRIVTGFQKYICSGPRKSIRKWGYKATPNTVWPIQYSLYCIGFTE